MKNLYEFKAEFLLKVAFIFASPLGVNAMQMLVSDVVWSIWFGVKILLSILLFVFVSIPLSNRSNEMMTILHKRYNKELN